jgi:hypothetical protein
MIDKLEMMWNEAVVAQFSGSAPAFAWHFEYDKEGIKVKQSLYTP